MSDTLKPVSIYTITAKLFAAVAKEVVDRFGEEGKQAIAEGVRKFGERRGRNIAANVEQAGKEKVLTNYLPYYDMERSKLFVYDSEVSDEKIEQKFYQCPFAAAWIEDGNQELGKLYCEQIDDAIAKGYDPRLRCVALKRLLDGDEYCHLIFEYEDKKEDK
ncbi:MAG TPA: L-2-amino-thiazoline-4-carboxylic acid hydrolase [Clostridia bacterium]|jgi:hypothetical protein|nr:L-2-amino-thiazoline-4-carboxylic acid hydrolase [Clostridia bacterium]